MQIIDYYKNRSSLAQIEEPYSGAVAIMEDFYINPPAECEKLVLNNFFDYAAISAVKTISDKLVKAGITFPTTLLWCKGQIIDSVHANNMDFGNYHVCRNWQAAIIFGCVYYVLAHNPKIPQKQLDYIEKVIAVDTESKLYFNRFKEPADKLRKKLIDGQTTIDVTENKDMAKLVTTQREQIKTLEAKVQELQKRPANATSQEDTSAGSYGPSCEEMTVELLMHIFYNLEENVKDFLQKIKGLSDVEITDIVHAWVKDKKISSKSYKRDLWRVLHAAKLYSATESNWNTVLRNHPR